MKFAKYILISGVIFWAGMCSASVVTENLRCEYLTDPLGIDATSPRLSWIITSTQRCEMQSAYQVLAASSLQLLNEDKGDLWDSGKVSSDDTSQIVYAGSPLVSRESCFWKVRTWDQDDEPGNWSQVAQWSMGLLEQSDWRGKWIGWDHGPKTNGFDGATWIWFPEGNPAERAPVATRYFRHTFELSGNQDVRAATIEITADDQFHLFVNDQEAGKGEGWGSPQKIAIGAFLKPGENVLAVEARNVGNGPNPAGLIAKLKVEFMQGSPLTLTTDGSWKSATNSEAGWNTLAFDDSVWTNAKALGEYGTLSWGIISNDQQPSPVPYLRKSFELKSPVQRAVLYVTALGLYEVHINGQRVGDHVLAPDWTDYRKRVRYQTFDVTDLMKTGGNAMGALLADGWFSGHIGNGGFEFFGKQPALLAQLEVTYKDGHTERVVTDDTWKSNDSPILSSDFMLGEDYDARMEIKGWDQAGLNESNWMPVVVRDESSRQLESQVMQPVRESCELKPTSIRESKFGSWIYDLGQNMVGVVRLRVSAPAGTKITLRHAEMLNPDGTLYTKNLRGAPSIDEYICKGDGVEIWQPRFTFHGFRYVEITGLSGQPQKDAVTGIVIGSDTPRTGEFTCSDARINQLQSNIQWGQRGNYISIPTDCPQRDERLGWMGDAQVFIRTATYNADVAAFFTKWLVDVDDGQSPAGAFSNVSPNTSNNIGGVPAWGDAGVICPWTIYEMYDDKRILEQHLSAMIKWVDYLQLHSDGLIRDKDRGEDFGDWLAIGADTPKDLIGTAYFAYSTHLLAKSCHALGRDAEADKYYQLFTDIKTAFNKRYVATDGRITGNTQCAYAMALKFELLPEKLRLKAAQYLEQDIKSKGTHLSTGFVGVSYLLPVLAQAGKADTAYGLLLQDSFPSWLFSVKHGATTIWERWDGWTPDKGFQDPGMNSFNHYSLGSCGEFLFGGIGGIRPATPGFKKIDIEPVINGGLTWARTSYDSIHGNITTAWKQDGDQISLEVTVPANTTATVYFPARDTAGITESGKPIEKVAGVKFLKLKNGKASLEVGSGTYKFISLIGHGYRLNCPRQK